MEGKFRFPIRTAVVAVAAVLFVSLAADWVQPGDGAHLACLVLRASCETTIYRLPSTNYFPLWSWLVGLAGRDAEALGAISIGAGLVCTWLVAAVAWAIFGAAVRGAKADGIKGEEGDYLFVRSAAVLIAGLAFALTPGLLVAATRISPLMVALAPGLAAAALAVGAASRGGDAARTIRRVRRNWPLALLAVGLVGYSAFELVLARRVFLALAFPALGVWLAVGVMPALVIAWCVWRRWLAGRAALWCAVGGWAAAVAVTGTVAFTSGRLNEGRSANRLVARIIAEVEESGKAAVVSDGALDDLFFFMLPEKVKLISLARERDPAYGRELSEWVRERGEDLAFAAELGPRALVDEWVKTDRAGFEAAAASVENYFPTREKWEEACAELDGMRADEPMAKYLRRLLGVTGNALGCRMIEQGDLKGARDVFWAVSEKIDRENYAALINLSTLITRGQDVPDVAKEIVKRRRSEIEGRLKTWERLLFAARSGGRLYSDPEDVAKYEKAKKEMMAKRELTPEERKLAETVAAAPKDLESGKAAQAAIHKAIREGRVRADKIGGHLIAIDLALGDGENAEKDAIDVLKLDRHDPTANAALGSLAGARGDHKRAERYLTRAIATGKASLAAKNDYAYALMKLGRIDEAEPFAREAVKACGGSWALRETLAAILIRKGEVDEGERELAKAEELAAKAGIPKGKVASIEIDRARLLKAKGDYEHLKMTMRALKSRKDLTDGQKAEVKGMDW